jgi:NAD(P)H-dependent FMN reductase
MPTVQIVTVSTRPGRKGPAVAAWFSSVARAHGGFTVEDVDLAEINLPVLDEPEHPRLGRYQHEHTRRWSETVSRGDAFVFVTPEYNFAPPPSLINALDFLFTEWAYKPAAFVSYGGVSGGLRGVQIAKQILTALNMMPIVPSVVLPMFASRLDGSGAFTSDESTDKAARAVLTELARWEGALRPLRAPRS